MDKRCALLGMVFLLLACLFPACSTSSNEWILELPSDSLSPTSGPSKTAMINWEENGLWVFYRYGDRLFQYSLTDQRDLKLIQELQMPSPVLINQACGQSGIVWIIDAKDFHLLAYDSQRGTLIPKPGIEDMAPFTECRDFANHTTALLTDKKLVLAQGEALDVFDLPVNIKPSEIAQDDTGTIWLLTDQGEIYKRVSRGGWQVYDTVEQGQTRIFATKDNIWLSASRKLSRWSLSDLSDRKVELTLPENDFIIHVVDDGNGKVWIVATNGIWTYEDEKLNQVEIPFGVSYINAATFDTQHTTLFISTDKGIYQRYPGK